MIHFAAESHVDNSISGPEAFFRTNIMGTFNLLDAAYQHWFTAPGVVKPEYTNSRFHHISTDEVYGSLDDTGYFKESTAYAPTALLMRAKQALILLYVLIIIPLA